jgi:hypothetical protein
MSFTGTYPNTIVLDNPLVQNPATVAATGLVQVTNADGILGIAGYPWTLANLGTIALLGTSGDGVHLTAGGVVTNGQTGSAGGSISAPTAGVEIDGAAGTVNNFGTIASPTPTGVGIILDAGGKIINGTSGDTAPLIGGAYNGIRPSAAARSSTRYHHGHLFDFNVDPGQHCQVPEAAGLCRMAVPADRRADRWLSYRDFVRSARAVHDHQRHDRGTATHCNDGAGADGPYGLPLCAQPSLNGAAGSTSALIEGIIAAWYRLRRSRHDYQFWDDREYANRPSRYSVLHNAIVLHDGGTIINYGLVKAVQNGRRAPARPWRPGTITNFGDRGDQQFRGHKRPRLVPNAVSCLPAASPMAERCRWRID